MRSQRATHTCDTRFRVRSLESVEATLLRNDNNYAAVRTHVPGYGMGSRPGMPGAWLACAANYNKFGQLLSGIVLAPLAVNFK